VFLKICMPLLGGGSNLLTVALFPPDAYLINLEIFLGPAHANQYATDLNPLVIRPTQ